jgi:hypothetical protein
MILIVGLTDYVIRNLLRSSFGARARQLNLRFTPWCIRRFIRPIGKCLKMNLE